MTRFIFDYIAKIDMLCLKNSIENKTYPNKNFDA